MQNIFQVLVFSYEFPICVNNLSKFSVPPAFLLMFIFINVIFFIYLIDGFKIIFFRCDSNGNFHRTQCYDHNGMCFCVFPNGTKIPGTEERGNPDCSRGFFQQI